jgi:hypothetical protein
VSDWPKYALATSAPEEDEKAGAAPLARCWWFGYNAVQITSHRETVMDEACVCEKPALTLRELEAQITELAGHLNAANYRWLSLIAEFDRREGWSDGSTQSCAHWLNWKIGIDMGAAREKVRVAHSLEELPRISAAMARGELSYSKARALTRVACAQTEEYFLSIALHGTAAHVEKLVRHYRRAQEAEELSREAQQQATRKVTYFYDDDGSLVLKGRLPAEIGALVIKALEAAVNDPAVRDVSAEIAPAEPAAWGLIVKASDERPSWGARRADALGRIAESFLQHGAEALSPGDRQQIVVHVDAETLRDGSAGRCELEDGPSLAVETVRRLACDASIVSFVENEHGEPLNVGRKTRSIPPAIRRALNARDRGCRFPGCANTRYVDAHHVHHWAQGGETKLSNLVKLCRFHHRQVHEGRVVIQRLDDGALRFLRPDGESFDSVAPEHTRPLSDWQQLPAVHDQQRIRIDQNTAATRWRGEKMDYGLAIEVLLQHDRRGQCVSAETR